ncbi:MAG TPA: Holliday junction resolvase RuvX [Candidatus Moranbacteria bacterium]|nr:Holliday junction resolvase RuvX [Candidatus Moranbacteria bacterium]
MTESNDPKTSHYLGIDFGRSKVGLAMADSETKIAFAYTTIDNDKDFLQKLVKIIQENSINKIIIGFPAYINKENVEYEGEHLGKLIKKLVDIDIEYQNEMFTTKMAQDNLIERGVKHVKNQDDQEAARIILQSWLDKS